jgi:hypothetical protein
MLASAHSASRSGRSPASRRRSGLRVSLAVSALAVGALLARPAGALTDEEVYRNLDFGVIQPSARALGMGAAFIGLADDPSATWYNPAGIAFLDRPQVMMELRGAQHDDVEVSLPGFYTEAFVNQATTGSILLEDQDVVSPSFLSYVHPIGRRFVIGVSRHERMHAERNTYTGFPAAFTPGALSTLARTDVLQDDYSITFAGTPHEALALGVTLGMSRLDVVQSVDNYVITQGLRAFDYRTQIDDDDTVFTFTAGLLWKPHDKIAVGLVYRDGAEFDLIEQVLQDGVRAADLRAFLAGIGVGNSVGELVNSFVFPDSYGVGLSFGPFWEPSGGGGLTVNFDAVQVEYADLLDNFTAGLNNQTFGPAGYQQAFDASDEVEYHLGLRWSWTVGYNNMVHVAAGAYTREDSSIVSFGRAVATADGPTVVGQFLPRDGDGDTQVHVTVGAGFTLRRGYYAFELNGAVDLSDVGEEYVGTANFRF